MASLSLKHIYKVYHDSHAGSTAKGGTRAVSDFNMEIRDREFIVFVGPSGCGKSTTLRMIAGLEEISAGELCIDGVVVNDMEPRDRNIAMVFQNYALYPHMTVYENMAFSLKTARMPKEEIQKKVLEAAGILGITEYLDRKPRALSGGQRQRVALGRAIVRSPKVFLFDEPLSNLDAKLRAAMRAEIIRLHERLGTTFIYVTHDQVEAMTMGSRIVVMRGGVVQQIDTPKNLYNHPANLFVAGFIGTPRMNFWNATLERCGERVTVRLASGERLSLPLATLDRVQSRYMDGRHPMIVGIRPDAVRPTGERAPAGEAAAGEAGESPRLPVTVRVAENLGGETLVYGVIGRGVADTAPIGAQAETDTPPAPAQAPDAERAGAAGEEIIFKAGPDFDVRRGETVEVAVDTARLLVFDRASEVCLTPRIPRENVVDGAVSGGVLRLAGQSFPLPPALRAELERMGQAPAGDAAPTGASGPDKTPTGAGGARSPRAATASTAATLGGGEPAAPEGDARPSVSCRVFLPADALRLGVGEGRATVRSAEAVTLPEGEVPAWTELPAGGGTTAGGGATAGTLPRDRAVLYRLEAGGELFFALEAGDTPRHLVGEALPFSPDFTRMRLEALPDGQGLAAWTLAPLGRENRLPGRLTRERTVDNRPGSPTEGRRIYRFYLDMADHPLEATPELREKLFSCRGTGIFRTELAFCFPPEALRVAGGEPGGAGRNAAPASQDAAGNTAARGHAGQGSVTPGRAAPGAAGGAGAYAPSDGAGIPSGTASRSPRPSSPEAADVRREDTLPARVTEVLDYGHARYIRVTLGLPSAGHSLLVPLTADAGYSPTGAADMGGRLAVGDRVHLTLDQGRITVMDREADIVIV